jgi:outer membrane lipoprotein SlyB
MRTSTKEIAMVIRIASLPVFLVAAALAACANIDTSPPGQPVRVVERIDYGTVERIDLYRAGTNAPTGLGLVLGGIAGGVVGHQIGGGRGNDLATVAGAIGGALAGNAIEKAKQDDRYRITVLLDDGRRLVLEQMGEGELRVGDRVRVVDERVLRL